MPEHSQTTLDWTYELSKLCSILHIVHSVHSKLWIAPFYAAAVHIQNLRAPISLQFISLAKLSPPVPHLTALHCKPLHRILVEMGGGLVDDGADDGDGDDVDVGVDGADGNGDAGDDDLAMGGWYCFKSFAATINICAAA